MVNAMSRALSWRGAGRRGHPAGISDGLPRPPSRARNDKRVSSLARSPARQDHEAIQPFDSAQVREPVERLRRHRALRASRDDIRFEDTS